MSVNRHSQRSHRNGKGQANFLQSCRSSMVFTTSGWRSAMCALSVSFRDARCTSALQTGQVLTGIVLRGGQLRVHNPYTRLLAKAVLPSPSITLGRHIHQAITNGPVLELLLQP